MLSGVEPPADDVSLVPITLSSQPCCHCCPNPRQSQGVEMWHGLVIHSSCFHATREGLLFYCTPSCLKLNTRLWRLTLVQAVTSSDTILPACSAKARHEKAQSTVTARCMTLLRQCLVCLLTLMSVTQRDGFTVFVAASTVCIQKALHITGISCCLFFFSLGINRWIGDKRSQSIVSDHKNELIQYSEDQTKCVCPLFVNGRVGVEVVQIKCLAECPTMSETLVPSINNGGRTHLAIYASFKNWHSDKCAQAALNK